MSLSTATGTKPCIAPAAVQRSAARPARSQAPFGFSQIQQRRSLISRGLKDDLIGRVNNPEESRENANRKKGDKDSAWATPAPNKNKLEKTTVAHGIGAEGSGNVDDEGIVNKAKEGIDDAVEGVKNAAEKLTGKGDD